MNQQEIIHFVHGNSFPAGSYRKMLAFIEPHYQVQYLDMHGHNPLYPVTDGWEFLVEELINELTRRYQHPVILLGHSLGGLLSLMAANQRPDLIRSVVMIDSPVVAGWKAMVLKLFKPYKFAEKFSPAQFSRNRRNLWTSHDEAFLHFKSKSVFSSWPNEVMQDYIDHGMHFTNQGVELKFSREVETSIYLTLPHHLGKIARTGIQVPIGFIGGTDSIECRQAGLEATKKIVKDNFMQIKAGHLMPMEVPAETAQLVLAMIKKIHRLD